MIDLCFSIQGKIFLSALMASVMCLHFSVQEEDIRVHFSQLVDQCIT